MPDSSVNVIVTVSDSGDWVAPSFALTANLYSRSVSRSLIVYDVSLPLTLSCLSNAPVLKIFSISNCVIVCLNVWDGGSHSRRAVVGDSAVIVTWVGLSVCSGFTKSLAPDGAPRPTSLRAVTLYE